ncbi:hypothetical protein TNCV_4930231 [Trichonephila clavipes]|nr:hypothetical protein TNCV_4930231 [Trichonephila clavipes]
MGMSYHPGIKAIVDGMAAHIRSRQSQSRTNAVKAQDYNNSVLGLVRCCPGGLYATSNNDQLRCLLCNSTEDPKSIVKQTTRHAVKWCFAPPRYRKASHFLNDPGLIESFD